jgi:hypothetical protein
MGGRNDRWGKAKKERPPNKRKKVGNNVSKFGKGIELNKKKKV